MKISIISDLHLNISLYKSCPDKEIPDLSFRVVDFMKAFKYMVNENINVIKPDLIVIAGDVYDTFDPSNSVRAFFNSQMRVLNNAKIPVLILLGNHDVCRRHSSLEPLASLELKGIKVIESPKSFLFKDNILALFPYSMEVERKDITIKDQFKNFVNELNDKRNNEEAFKGKEIIFFGHFGVKGARLNDYNEKNDELITLTTSTTTMVPVINTPVKKSYINSNDKDISLSDLDTIGANYVFLGDYHQHQVLGTKKCIAMYTGSIEKSDMTEIDQRKGFVVYDTEAEEIESMGKCRFIEYPNCRPMIELKGSFKDIESQLEKCNNHNGAVVKISFVGNAEELTSFSIGLDAFKRKLKAKVNPVHVYNQQKIIDDEEETAATALENEIMDKGHLESTDVLDVVGEMIKEKIKEDHEVTILENMSNEIYKEAMLNK